MAPLNRSWARLGLLAALLAAGALLTQESGLGQILRDPEARAGAVESLRSISREWWVGPAYAAGYAALVALALPASALTLIGGAAFGLARGILWVTLGANLGASLAFLLARRLGRSALADLLGSRLAGFDRVADVAGFQGLLILRLIPVVPFSLLNFAAGLTPIRWGAYGLATAIGILPGTVVYVFFADALLAGTAGAGREALLRLLLAGVLLIGFSLVTRWLLNLRVASSRSSSPP